MNRRIFVRNSALASLSLPLKLQGHPLVAHGMGSDLVASMDAAPGSFGDRIVVIVNLTGGNDGLNMVVPVAEYGEYLNLRQNIAIPQNKLLMLDGVADFGLHPALSGIRDLYNDGLACVVHGAGYPNPNQSHARSSDIWMTGTAADVYENTGWAARYLQHEYAGFPVGYPNPQMEDPIALQIGFSPTPTFHGDEQSVAVNITDANQFYQLIGEGAPGNGGELPCCDAGDLVTYVRNQQLLAVGYSAEIKQAADAGANLALYPASNKLGDQLKIVARLIHGGLKTRMYFVQMGGFDTHATQADVNDNSIGVHANLLKTLGDALKSFQDDLKMQGTDHRVVTMTFSEFGRRANSNGSRGTDHGHCAPMFVMGKALKKFQLGTINRMTEDLVWQTPGSPTSNKFVGMQIDFRRVYTDMLNDWMGNDPSDTSSILFQPFSTTSLFRNTIETVQTGPWTTRATWSTGRPPLPAEQVIVRPGHTLSIAQNVTMAGMDVQGNVDVAPGVNLNITG